jgi:putative ABC transport system permease protein
MPAARREEWVEEWRGELFHAREEASSAGESSGAVGWRLRRRAAGALHDALWLRRAAFRPPRGGWPLRDATRVLRRQPAFVLMVVCTLGLGIGAATAIFTVVDGLLLRPLPFQEPERLVRVIVEAGDDFSVYASRDRVRVWRAHDEVFEALHAFSQRGVTLTRPGEPRSLRASLIEPGALRMLGVPPILGREFLPEETVPGRDRVVLLSHDEWRVGFGGDPEIVGSTVHFDDEPYTVLGVMPPTVRVLPGGIPQIALPLPDTAQGWLMLLARLRGTTPIAAAQERLDAVAATLDAEQAGEDGWGVRLTRLERVLADTTRRGLVALSGAVALLLLVACVNAAGLLFVRGVARRPELAIRRALGASSATLFRQSLVESLVLSLLSGAAGIALAWWGVRALVALAPDVLIRFSYNPIAIDARVLGFALLLTIATGVAFGVAPAVRASRTGALGVGRRTSGGSREDTRLRAIVHAFQLALAVMLLAGAAVLGRSFLRLTAVDIGFDPRNLVLLSYSLPSFRFENEAQRAAFNRELDARLRVLPGLDAVSWSSHSMVGRNAIHFAEGFETEAGISPREPAEEPLTIPFGSVDSAYFRTMRIPLLEGRAFTEADARGETGSVIVDVDVARRLWPGQRAVGRRFRIGPESPWLTVVGVTADVKLAGPDDSLGPYALFYPTTAARATGGDVILRASRDPTAIAAAVRDVMRSLHPELPIQIRTATQLEAETVELPRFLLAIMIAFAAIALLLAAIGIYGLVSFTVAGRTREIGIRIAIGARRGQVVGRVLGGGLLISAVGLVLGLAGAAALARFLAGLVFETSPLDPAALAIVAVVLVLASCLALLAPARRAAGVDPAEALRAE